MNGSYLSSMADLWRLLKKDIVTGLSLGVWNGRT
jgi:hypothetical protein